MQPKNEQIPSRVFPHTIHNKFTNFIWIPQTNYLQFLFWAWYPTVKSGISSNRNRNIGNRWNWFCIYFLEKYKISKTSRSDILNFKRGKKNLPLLLICSNNVADTSDEVTFWESIRVSFLSAEQYTFATNNNVKVMNVRLWRLILSLSSSFKRHW